MFTIQIGNCQTNLLGIVSAVTARAHYISLLLEPNVETYFSFVNLCCYFFILFNFFVLFNQLPSDNIFLELFEVQTICVLLLIIKTLRSHIYYSYQNHNFCYQNRFFLLFCFVCFSEFKKKSGSHSLLLILLRPTIIFRPTRELSFLFYLIYFIYIPLIFSLPSEFLSGNIFQRVFFIIE